jgi:hypothetical protein
MPAKHDGGSVFGENPSSRIRAQRTIGICFAIRPLWVAAGTELYRKQLENLYREQGGEKGEFESGGVILCGIEGQYVSTTGASKMTTCRYWKN